MFCVCVCVCVCVYVCVCVCYVFFTYYIYSFSPLSSRGFWGDIVTGPFVPFGHEVPSDYFSLETIHSRKTLVGASFKFFGAKIVKNNL